MNDKELFELSDRYLAARKQKEELEMRLKDANAVLDECETKLIESMIDDELTGFKRNDVQFSLVSKSYISAEPEHKDELWERMKEQGFESLFTINANTLSGEVKRMMSENDGALPTWLEGLIKQYEKPSIRIKK